MLYRGPAILPDRLLVEPKLSEEDARAKEEEYKISVERRNNQFYREGLYGYVSFKTQKDTCPKAFIFPLSREGFEII
jgi:hypothetical protein